MSLQQIKVPAKASGQTLLTFLREFLAEYPSVKAIKRAIDNKKCKINGRVEYFSTHKVKEGDTVEITLETKKEKVPIETLFEDEHLIIYNKPSGKTSESFEGFYLVHRLDKDTSGVFLLAKTEPMKEMLIDLFRQREVEKEYIAICDKAPKQTSWKTENYLGVKASYQGGKLYGSVAKEEGKKATTFFEVAKTTDDASLILAKPITGRTHQIRVHLKEKGHPVLGDWQYAKTFTCPHHPERMMLHAHKLHFIHPVTKEKCSITAPLFNDFKNFQKKLFGA